MGHPRASGRAYKSGLDVVYLWGIWRCSFKGVGITSAPGLVNDVFVVTSADYLAIYDAIISLEDLSVPLILIFF